MKISTKTGDDGTTSLRDGTRVRKDDARMELNGALDELNALFGWCKIVTGTSEPFETLQKELMMLMTVVADMIWHTTGREQPERALRCTAELQHLAASVQRMEHEIARISDGRVFSFVLPGKDVRDAALHLARTKVRTCERRLVTLAYFISPLQQSSAPADRQLKTLQSYLNRLSDYLFCLSIE